jgi:hypothetical protein
LEKRLEAAEGRNDDVRRGVRAKAPGVAAVEQPPEQRPRQVLQLSRSWAFVQRVPESRPEMIVFKRRKHIIHVMFNVYLV